MIISPRFGAGFTMTPEAFSSATRNLGVHQADRLEHSAHELVKTTFSDADQIGISMDTRALPIKNRKQTATNRFEYRDIVKLDGHSQTGEVIRREFIRKKKETWQDTLNTAIEVAKTLLVK